jgi:hypothetical protein
VSGFAAGGGAELACVVPDEKHPGMWRVRSPDGGLSDMVNITRAKDAAATMVLAVLNRSDDVLFGAGDGTQKGKTKSAGRVPPDSGRAPTGDWHSLTDARTTEGQARIPETLPGVETPGPSW